MVQDGEKYKDEDMKLRKKIDAKNALENYCFQMKNSINDEKLKEKLSEEDKKVIEDSCAEGIEYLESNQDASLEEYEAKKSELESKINPIMMKLYQGAEGNQRGMPDEGMQDAGEVPAGAAGADDIGDLD